MSTALVLSGLFLALVMQLTIFGVAAKQAPDKAALCLVIPLYVYVYGRKEPKARPLLWGWYGGLLLLLVGALLAG